jgi:hypothetical protein
VQCIGHSRILLRPMMKLQCCLLHSIALLFQLVVWRLDFSSGAALNVRLASPRNQTHRALPYRAMAGCPEPLNAMAVHRHLYTGRIRCGLLISPSHTRCQLGSQERRGCLVLAPTGIGTCTGRADAGSTEFVASHAMLRWWNCMAGI